MGWVPLELWVLLELCEDVCPEDEEAGPPPQDVRPPPAAMTRSAAERSETAARGSFIETLGTISWCPLGYRAAALLGRIFNNYYNVVYCTYFSIITIMIDVALSSATELCAELGSRLRSQRLAMRIPQEELAKRAGLNVNTIRNVEGRTGTASLDSVVRFALALGLADQFQSLFGWQIKSIAQMEQAQSAPRQRARPRRRR